MFICDNFLSSSNTIRPEINLVLNKTQEWSDLHNTSKQEQARTTQPLLEQQSSIP
jgi:hypothetical protein